MCDASHKVHQSRISEPIDCDLKFHQVIEHALNNNILGEYLCLVQDQFFGIQKLISHKPALMLADLPKIIKALKARDGNKMEELMVNHVENFVKDVRKHFKMED